MALWSDASKDRLEKNAHKIQVKRTTQSLIKIVAISPPGGRGQVQFRPLQHRLHRSPPLSSSPRHLRPHPPLRLSLRLLRRLLLPALPRAGCRGRLPPGPRHIRGGVQSNVSIITLLFKVTMHLPGQIYSFVVILLGNSLYWQVLFQTN